MPPKNNPSQIIAKSISLFMLIGALIWLLLLVLSANKFRLMHASSYGLNIGPITLDTFSRHSVSQGQRIGISMEPGLIVYFLIYTTAGLLTGLYQIKKQR